jgi:hypothetical protein
MKTVVTCVRANVMLCYHKRERNGDGCIGLDDPEKSEANQLDQSVHVDALQANLSQVGEIGLVL